MQGEYSLAHYDLTDISGDHAVVIYASLLFHPMKYRE